MAPTEVEAIQSAAAAADAAWEHLDVVEGPVLATIGEAVVSHALEHDVDVLAEPRVALLGLTSNAAYSVRSKPAARRPS